MRVPTTTIKSQGFGVLWQLPVSVLDPLQEAMPPTDARRSDPGTLASRVPGGSPDGVERPTPS
jgi:hypothetical protein